MGFGRALPDSGSRAPSIPDYELLRRIGGGAYGEVWLARSVATGIFRAAKIVYRRNFGDERPFLREFEGIQHFERISRAHPSQLALFHIGRNDAEGYFYYVMELADDAGAKPDNDEARPAEEATDSAQAELGEYRGPRTLRADLAYGRLPVGQVLQLGLALAEALGHLHQHGLVHRDVKPSNVIFVKGRPKLADIGLVTDVSDECSIVGTEGYLPPEGPGSPQADLFALGKTLYEAATGLDRRQFPLLPRDLRLWPDSNDIFELNELLLKACASNLADRYATGEEMKSELQDLVKGKSLLRRRTMRTFHGGIKTLAWWCAASASLVLLAMWTRHALIPGDSIPAEYRSTNAVANRHYDVGRHYLEKPNEQDWFKAADNFRRAIAADPRFAQAYATLALTDVWRMGQDPENLISEAKDCASKALAWDEKLPEAHIALGWYRVTHEWDWKAAGREFERAVHLQPGNPACHQFYAEWLRMSGHTNEAIHSIYHAFELAPRSIFINMRLVDHLVGARRFEEAIAQADHVLAMEPDSNAAGTFRIRAQLALGRFDDAIAGLSDLRKRRGEPLSEVQAYARELEAGLQQHGRAGFWEVVCKASKNAHEGSYWQAETYSQMGKPDQALDCLEQSLRAHDLWLTFYVMTDWSLDPLRNSARFQAILASMHLAADSQGIVTR